MKGDKVEIPAELWEGKTGGLTATEIATKAAEYIGPPPLRPEAFEKLLASRADQRVSVLESAIGRKILKAQADRDALANEKAGAAMERVLEESVTKAKALQSAITAWELYRSGGATIEEITPLLDMALGAVTL